jgi:hypothetical protein
MDLVRRIIHVAVHNAGDGFLSDCKLSVKDCSPPVTDGRLPAALIHNVTLMQGEYRFVPVVGFVEKVGGSSHSHSDNIIISVPVSGSFFFGGWTMIGGMPSRNDAAILTLEATALECRACTMHYRVWVDNNRRLRMEPA